MWPQGEAAFGEVSNEVGWVTEKDYLRRFRHSHGGT
jgi:hypothetical protein